MAVTQLHRSIERRADKPSPYWGGRWLAESQTDEGEAKGPLYFPNFHKPKIKAYLNLTFHLFLIPLYYTHVKRKERRAMTTILVLCLLGLVLTPVISVLLVLLSIPLLLIIPLLILAAVFLLIKAIFLLPFRLLNLAPTVVLLLIVLLLL